MDLPCSRAETEAAPWAQGQGCRAGNTRNSRCLSSSSISHRLLLLIWKLGLGWRAGKRGERWCQPGLAPEPAEVS